MDKDLEDRLAKINIENDMNRSLQLEMLLTSAKMIRDESLRAKVSNTEMPGGMASTF